ncbi:MAG: hypothetical protein ACAI25_11055, partial [Planctomycetota bacterium]
YAGRPLRGLGLLLAAPAAIALTAAGALPLAAYAFLHGYVAFDGYRCARKRNGAWSTEDAREARGVWFATLGAVVLLGLAHAAGAPFSPALLWPAVLIPLGVGLALGERTNRVNKGLELTPAPQPKSPPTPPTPPTPPAPPAPPKAIEPAPGVDIDRRADRAKLAEQLCG